MERDGKISVLIVDDSALMRSLIAKIVESDSRLCVMDKAMNGRFAFQRLCFGEPDVIVLDIEMPEMNGLEFLERRKKAGIEIPVVILSSIAKRGAAVTMECLEKGAADFVTKPSGSESANLHTVADRLISLLVGFGGRYRDQRLAGKTKPLPLDLLREYGALSPAEARVMMDAHPLPSAVRPETPAESAFPGETEPECAPSLETRGRLRRRAEPGKIEIIAIGISTGGPNALRTVFPKLDPLCIRQPVVVVQHMPPGFTEEFANSLNKICPLEVREAHEGDLLKPGRILIAPGDRHLLVEKRSLAATARLSDAPQRNGHRPSADVLFESVCREYGNHALGIIMTGMGRDGAAEMASLYEAGSRTLGQDEASSIVYGMPKAAMELGALDEQVSLEQMAETINRWAKEFG